jgi:hypothetical protein
MCLNETAIMDLGSGATEIRKSDLAVATSQSVELESILEYRFFVNKCDTTQYQSLID